jgi:hypothetical protein
MNYPKPQIHQIKKTIFSRYCYTPKFKTKVIFNNPEKAHPLKIPSWFIIDTPSPRMPDFNRSIYGEELSLLVKNASETETDVILFGPYLATNFGNSSKITITSKHDTYSNMIFRVLNKPAYIGQIDLLSEAGSDIIKNAYQMVILRDQEPVPMQNSTVDWDLRSINALRCFLRGDRLGRIMLNVPPRTTFEINIYLEK